jgi:flagellar basal body-associated protein FliL
MKIKTKKSKLKVIIAIVIVLVLAAAAYLALAFYKHYPPFMEAQQKTTDGQTVNLERSDAENEKIKDIQDNPESKTKNDQNDTPKPPTQNTSSGKQSVNVLLTNASIINNTVRASGFVTNIVEEGGECTYIFTNGTSTLTKKATTLTNPTSTTCETVTFSPAELPVGGTWKVVLKYSSSKAEGTSNTKEFTK